MNKLTSFLTLTVAALTAPAAFAAGDVSITATTPQHRQVTVTALTDNIIKVTNVAEGTAAAESRTVALKSADSDAKTINAAGADILITPSGIVATLDPATGSVTIAAGAGRTVTDDGVRQLADGKQVMTLTTPGSESFYGAGERGFKLNLASDTLVMFNRQNYGYTARDPRIRQMNITMPLIISSKGYALLFDDYAAAELITGNPLKYVTESRQPVSYYFINGAVGDTPDARLASVVGNLSQLTGRQELPPLWSLGYITSKYGYHDEAETRGVVDTLKRAGYPLDGIVLDLYWYGKEEDMGRLEWDPQQWPTAHKMLADLKAKGVNLVAISQPYVLRNGRAIDNYNELAPKGMFVRDKDGNPGEVTIWVGHGGMFDVSNPDTRQWLANRYKELTDGGITGWWGDLGEPEVHPDSLVHYNGLGAREYHNLYGNDWSQIIYDLFKEQYPDRRLMTMMRGGTVGLQRYNVFPWSTDVSRSWGGLQPQVVIMLNSGLSGLGYMSHDVGGFAIDHDNPIDPELYVRWLQLGTFSPILRTHSQEYAEPYKYPEQEHIILPLIKERYAWLPYNYTLAYENAALGMPLVRPLNFYSPGVTDFDNVTDEYLWGRDLLVAPVMTQGATSRDIVFPEGVWIDALNPANSYVCGQTINYPAPLEVLPMFVRGGAFIPRADYKMDNTRDYKTSAYTVRFYPVEGQSDGMIFEDDLSTPTTIAEGRYTLIKFASDVTDKSIDIDITAENGSADYVNPQPVKTLKFEIYNVASKPASVTLNGKKVSAKYNAKTSTLVVDVKFTLDTPARLSIAL